MNCEKARNLILTDYLDDQMDVKARCIIEEHMARCPECKNLYLEAKKATDELSFNTLPRANPPEYVWRRVKMAILAEKENKKSLLSEIFANARNFLRVPRPVLATVSVIMLIIVIGTAAGIGIGVRNAYQSKLEVPADYFSYLTDTPAENTANGTGGFGTAVEKYFL